MVILFPRELTASSFVFCRIHRIDNYLVYSPWTIVLEGEYF